MLVAGRNSPCPCGSGKKYKRCCEAKEAEMRESLLPAGRFRYEFGSYGGPSDMTHK
ncbi:MAG: SEC-C metal-binding domain-containing protein [Syntrophorhabdales bacterium]